MPFSKSHITTIFAPLLDGNSTEFFTHMTPDLHFTVTGSSHRLAKTYYTKETYLAEAWAGIGEKFDKGMRLSVVGVVVEPYSKDEGEGEDVGMKGMAVVELKGEGGVLKSGKECNNEYCWVVGFNEEGFIESVRAYLDSALLRDALEE